MKVLLPVLEIKNVFKGFVATIRFLLSSGEEKRKRKKEKLLVKKHRHSLSLLSSLEMKPPVIRRDSLSRNGGFIKTTYDMSLDSQISLLRPADAIFYPHGIHLLFGSSFSYCYI